MMCYYLNVQYRGQRVKEMWKEMKGDPWGEVVGKEWNGIARIKHAYFVGSVHGE